MDGKTSHLLPVTLPKKKTPDDAVQQVSEWALLTAALAANYPISYAVGHYLIPCGQAAAAVLALRLPRHHRWLRRALSYLTLVLAAVIHCMYAVAAAARLFLVDDPRDLFSIFCTVATVFFMASDIRSFLALLRGNSN
ncbi:hypothetical protein VPH35_087984 [Triticum aestivum]